MYFDNISKLASRCLKGRQYIIRSNHLTVSDLDESQFHVVREDNPFWNEKGVLVVLLDDGEEITLQWLKEQITVVQRDESFSLLRQERDKLLKETDYLMNPDYPHPTEDIKQQWIQYRQALRDLPTNSDPTLTDEGKLDKNSVVWPIKPT